MTAVAPAPSPRPIPRERTPRARQIIDAARALLEEVGSDGLTMRRLASEIGIKAPSLYKHFTGRPALELALAEVGLEETGLVLHAAVAGAEDDPVTALLGAYRACGRANPELYRLITAHTFPRADLLPGLEAFSGEPFFLAMGDPYLAQALWSFAHGTLILELDHRFLEGSDLDVTWRAGAEAFRSSRLTSRST